MRRFDFLIENFFFGYEHFPADEEGVERVEYRATYGMPDGVYFQITTTRLVGRPELPTMFDIRYDKKTVYNQFLRSIQERFFERCRSLSGHESLIWVKYYAERGLLQVE